jgi:hypothetical protein
VGRLARDIEEVLDRHERAVQRTERDARAPARVGGVCGGARLLGIDLGEGLLGTGLVEAREESFEAVADAGHDVTEEVVVSGLA